MTTAAQLRDAGQADVLAADTAPHRDYASLVREAIAELDEGPDFHFTAEDVRWIVERHYPEVQPHSPNVLPAVLGSLASAGRIRAVGHTRCTRSSRRHGWMRVWQVTPRSAGGVTPAP